ncbi:MAG: V-type ATP synthase subunit F [Lachnospira sp.]|nr:V-type ATP synthase subunit F [Lachnospira sp.]
MSNMVMLGDYDSIFGFTAVGITVYPVKTMEEARKQFKHFKRQETEVIFITEQFALELAEEIKEMREKSDIAVILIPGLHGNTGEGIANIKKMVERAVGSDILFS